MRTRHHGFYDWNAKTIKQHDGVWVVVDRLTKGAHFLAIKATFTSEQLANLYIKEIVRVHGVPLSIVSDHDTKFVSRFWHGFQRAMGTELRLSMASTLRRMENQKEALKPWRTY